MRILGVSGGFGHDAAAALVVDGRPVFALEQERITRVKEAPWTVPTGAIVEALAATAHTMADIDALAVSWDPSLMADEARPGIFLDDVVSSIFAAFGTCPPVATLPHHLCHAAAAYHTSGFPDAAIVVVDDRGENRSGSIYRGSGTRIDDVLALPIRASLGAMYNAATRHVGFDGASAGKTMGLAAYGTPDNDLAWLQPDADGYRFASDFVSGFGPDTSLPDWPAIFAHAFGPATAHRRHDDLDGIPRRHRTLAASAQAALERCLQQLATVALARTGSNNLVLGGGVALNCSANGRLRRFGSSDDLFVLGAAGDAGGALGAALWLAIDNGDPRPGRLRSLALGSPASGDAVVHWATSLGLDVHHHDAPVRVARAVGRGEIGGWFQGRDELGPRALGNRSIVARADDRAVADRVNRIKGRESWRPLAPVLTTDLADSLGLGPTDRGLDFMVEARWPEPAPILAGATHVDRSTRPLAVDDPGHPFAPLLSAVAEVGDAALVNTSFNVAGEPLVHTARDAFRTFCASDLDFLCIEDVVVAKPGRCLR